MIYTGVFFFMSATIKVRESVVNIAFVILLKDLLFGLDVWFMMFSQCYLMLRRE